MYQQVAKKNVSQRGQVMNRPLVLYTEKQATEKLKAQRQRRCLKFLQDYGSQSSSKREAKAPESEAN